MSAILFRRRCLKKKNQKIKKKAAMMYIPDMSLMSTWLASSFSLSVAVSDCAVMPEVLATAAASVSVSAAPAVLMAGGGRGQVGAAALER